MAVYNKPGQQAVCDGRTFTIGGQVRANECDDLYCGLIGTVTEIRTGDDKDTENETDDIYVSFDEPFTEHTNRQLRMRAFELDDLALDCCIEAPEMLDFPVQIPIEESICIPRDKYAAVIKYLFDAEVGIVHESVLYFNKNKNEFVKECDVMTAVSEYFGRKITSVQIELTKSDEKVRLILEPTGRTISAFI